MHTLRVEYAENTAFLNSAKVISKSRFVDACAQLAKAAQEST